VRVTVVRASSASGAGLRTCIATVEIMTGVTFAHTWAGGVLPALPWLVGMAALVFGASRAVLRHRLGLRVAVAALGGAQVGLHGVLTWMAPSAHATHDGPATGWTWQMAAAHAATVVLTIGVWAARRRAVEMVLAWLDDPATARIPELLGLSESTAGAPPRLRPWLALPHPRGPPPWLAST
jgi:hypothetical protein